jgi:Mg-chelatase subunit ChlD
MCRVVLGYQDEPGERAITSAVSGLNGRHVELSVALTRATRGHRDVRMGSSVRGAIDLALLLTGLAELRGEAPPARETARDAAYAALSGRIRIADGVDRTPESVLDELLDELWPADPAAEPDEPPADAEGKADRLPSPSAGFEPRSRPGREQSGRTQSRAQLAARHPAFEGVSPELGSLDATAFDELLAREPEAAAALLADLAVATDAQLRAAARRLAGRVFLRLGRIGPARSRGTRRLGPSRSLEGDLDLDRTLDRWSPGRSGRLEATDLVTRTWTAHRRAVCLIVDISGSMEGLAVALAAVAAAGVVLANEHGPPALEPSVLAFGTGVRVLQAQGVRRVPEELLSELVALRGYGVTDLAAGLRAAAVQLAGAVTDERVVVLLSDCLHTAGDDPAGALGGIDRLHVLVPLGGAEAEAAAAALAARGGGRAQTVRRLAEIGPALTRILA